MDSVFGKFSVFDFFNLICTGAIFMAGLQFMGIQVLSLFSFLCSVDIFKNSSDNNVVNIIFYVAVIIGACYIIGSCIQEFGSFLQKKKFRVQENAVSSFLNNPKVINNEVKRQVYIKEAKKVFNKKGIRVNNNSFSEEQCNYFFAYCVYYIQVREHHQKTEKMRELHGISNMLSTGFAILTIVNVFVLIFNIFSIDEILYIEKISLIRILALIFIFAILSVVFWFRMKKNILYRIRMVLGIYEASIDKDTINSKSIEEIG